MQGEAYELLAMLMRYVFIALGGLILFRAYRQMRRDARAYKKEMKKLPDAGLGGGIVDLQTGKSQPLPREGMIGSSAACDIRLKRRGVKRRHAMFEFVEGKGLRIRPHLGHKVAMEGVPIRTSAYALHGTEVMIGQAPIRIRLFAGLNVPHPASFAREMPVEEMPPAFEMPLPFEKEGFDAPLFEQPEEMQEENLAYPPFVPVEQEVEEEAEAIPYFSPVERHRRSGRR